MTSISFRLRQMLRQMWFLPAMFCVAAVTLIAVAHYTAFLLPEELPLDVSNEAIDSILSIVAASMLSVTVFALATMVNALAAASQSATPRAVRLISEDRRAQTSISVFIGAFIFSVVGVIGLSGGFYSESGRLILFGATTLVVAIVVGALIRWINLISSIGRVGETIRRVEEAANAAFDEIACTPHLGCGTRENPKEGSCAVCAITIGHVLHIEPARLQELAEQSEIEIHIDARPGTFVSPSRPLAFVSGAIDDEVEARVREAFVIGDERTFDHDPRFGLIVLGEIASRALSPGVNDPGTAIAIVHTHLRVLARWLAAREKADAPTPYPLLTVAPISPDDLVDDAFRPIVRDGAGNVEVCLKLVTVLGTLGRLAPDLLGPATARMTRELLERACGQMSYEADLRAVEARAADVGGAGPSSRSRD